MVDRERFVDQCQVVNEFILQVKTAYYSRIIDGANMIPNAYSLFLTSFFIVKVNLNYLILRMMSP